MCDIMFVASIHNIQNSEKFVKGYFQLSFGRVIVAYLQQNKQHNQARTNKESVRCKGGFVNEETVSQGGPEQAVVNPDGWNPPPSRR